MNRMQSTVGPKSSPQRRNERVPHRLPCPFGAWFILLAALTATASCLQGETDSQPIDDIEVPGDVSDSGPIEYPLDDLLRLNHIQVKGTHNSYHVAPDVTHPPDDWDYTHAPLQVQLAEYGVRQVELDVHYEPEGFFKVYHVHTYDPRTTCDRLVDCLWALRNWSDANPGHHLLFVLIEPKNDVDIVSIAGHYDELDAEILSVWPRDRLVTPDDVRGDSATLREALEQEGWPTLGATRNRALFFWIDSGDHREGYLDGHPTLEGRVMFVRGGQGEAYGAILEFWDPLSNQNAIREVVEAGYLVRTSSDEPGCTDEENRATAEAALNSGAHLISTDFPAPVEDREYWFDLPDGWPSRCNPVTAPSECSSEDIEALSR